MSLNVYTARVGAIDSLVIDVSRKSGGEIGRCFAPSWHLLRPFLERRKASGGRVSDAEWAAYTAAYAVEMEHSRLVYGGVWADLLSRRKVVLTCYCTDPERCHRVLLARMLEEMGAIYCGEK